MEAAQLVIDNIHEDYKFTIYQRQNHCLKGPLYHICYNINHTYKCIEIQKNIVAFNKIYHAKKYNSRNFSCIPYIYINKFYLEIVNCNNFLYQKRMFYFQNNILAV